MREGERGKGRERRRYIERGGREKGGGERGSQGETGCLSWTKCALSTVQGGRMFFG